MKYLNSCKKVGGIALVMPPLSSKWDRSYRQRYPTTLLFLADYLYQHGYHARIIDCNSNEYSLDDYIKVLSNLNPKVVGFTSCTENRLITYTMIRMTKHFLPDSKIIVGGPHFSPTAKEALMKIPEIDVVVIGDGEATLLDLISAFFSKGSISGIPGVAYREGDRIVFTEYRSQDTIPVLANDIRLFLDDNGKHTPYIEARNAPGELALPVFSSVGCNFRCVFCNYSRRPHIRKKSVQDLIREVKICQAKYNHNIFQFVAADFLMDKNYVKDICIELKKFKVIPRWWTMGRVDSDPSILQTMKEAGCYNLDFSLESGSPNILKAIKKALRFSDVLAYAKECHKLGIKCSLFVMVSLPEETEDDFAMTKDAVNILRPYVTSFLVSYTVIYPGTELEERARRLHLIPSDFSWYTNPSENGIKEEVPLYMENFTIDQIHRFCGELVRIGDGQI